MGFEAPGEVCAAQARRVLTSAELASRGAGHENSGFLSEAAGFMPLAAPKLSLPAEFAAWDEVAAELPHLHGTLRLRPRLDALPHLGRELPFLPESSLRRAGHLLAMLAHAYQYVETTPPEGLPQAWSSLGRKCGGAWTARTRCSATSISAVQFAMGTS